MSTPSYAIAPHAVFVDLGEQLAILDTENDRYLGLNDVGASLWAHLSTPQTVEQLVEHTVAEYDVTPAVARSDIESLIRDLVSRGLVRAC